MIKKLMILVLVTLTLLTGTRYLLAAADGTPLKILKRPIPTSQGCQEPTGKTVLRVAFESTATIGDVIVRESSGCSEFDRRAIDAARNIEFRPATKEANPITVSKSVVYEFSRHK